jgi:hypothetical protein
MHFNPQNDAAIALPIPAYDMFPTAFAILPPAAFAVFTGNLQRMTELWPQESSTLTGTTVEITAKLQPTTGDWPPTRPHDPGKHATRL